MQAPEESSPYPVFLNAFYVFLERPTEQTKYLTKDFVAPRNFANSTGQIPFPYITPFRTQSSHQSQQKVVLPAKPTFVDSAPVSSLEVLPPQPLQTHLPNQRKIALSRESRNEEEMELAPKHTILVINSASIDSVKYREQIKVP